MQIRISAAGKPYVVSKNAKRDAHPLAWRSWAGMKSRCLSQTNKDFPHYGGRGITVCERWMIFENFLADMGDRPSSRHSLDRIDNNRGYSPDNCRWATHSQQQSNKRARRLKPLTHCKRGHEFTDENIAWQRSGRWKVRACRTCIRMKQRGEI